MPRDDDIKVFDVSKPHKSEPSASSRPVIVGHHPTMADPMVREAFKSHHGDGPKIEVKGDEDNEEKIETHHTFGKFPLGLEESAFGEHSNFGNKEHSDHEDHDDHMSEHKTFGDHSDHKEPEPPYKIEMPGSDDDGLYNNKPAGHNTPLFADKSEDEPESPKPSHTFNTPKMSDSDHSLFGGHKSDSDMGSNTHHPTVRAEDWVEPSPLHIPHGAGPYRRWPKVISWVLILLLLVVIGGYLAIDAGIVKSNMKLPFHIFNKQKTSTVAEPAPAPAPVAKAATPAASALPQGFTKYSVPDTTLSFAYPTAWGAPTTTADPGFSQRSTKGKSDGTYAYVINFATSKDVQIAISSSKYLFTHPDAHYYDYLKWCVGTNDGKFYKESLHFNTTAGVDTPSTVACDKGPLDTAVKVDATTIMQPKYKESAKDITGDLYTKNLKASDLTVLRVMDLAMTNGAQVKQLLGTVKETAQ